MKRREQEEKTTGGEGKYLLARENSSRGYRAQEEEGTGRED